MMHLPDPAIVQIFLFALILLFSFVILQSLNLNFQRYHLFQNPYFLMCLLTLGEVYFFSISSFFFITSVTNLALSPLKKTAGFI